MESTKTNRAARMDIYTALSLWHAAYSRDEWLRRACDPRLTDDQRDKLLLACATFAGQAQSSRVVLKGLGDAS